MGKWSRIALSAVAAAFLALGLGQPAQAGLISVIGDVNTQQSGNLPFYDNVLGSSTNVVFSRNAGNHGSVLNSYNAKAGVTATQDSSTITASLLSGVDLLVVTRGFNSALNYSAAEIAAINTFLHNDGDLLLIAEAFTSTVLDNYNDFLAGVGSSIRYTGDRFGVSQTISPLEVTSLTAGVTQFQVSAYNTLSGGTAAAIATNGTVVAFESVSGQVPEPGAFALLGAGLIGLGALRCRRAA